MQLRMLAQLTQTEIQIARIRTAQATTDAVRRELQRNGDNAVDRLDAIMRTMRDLGGIPDVVTPAIGRLSALVKSQVEQAGPLDEALLSDLTLEHQLLDRATYVKVLAETADLRAVAKLAERLITAHSATVEWLTVVLAEEALGGPAALRATALQRLTGTAGRAAGLPVKYAAETVNRTLDTVQQSAEQAREKINAASERATYISGFARDVLTAGRNASLKRAEKVAGRDGNREGARVVHKTRAELGALDEAELPIKNYEGLASNDAVKAIRRLNKVSDVRTMMAYEEAHAARRGVISAAQTRVAALAKDAVNVG
jgi:hypothetical protein